MSRLLSLAHTKALFRKGEEDVVYNIHWVWYLWITRHRRSILKYKTLEPLCGGTIFYRSSPK